MIKGDLIFNPLLSRGHLPGRGEKDFA